MVSRTANAISAVADLQSTNTASPYCGIFSLIELGLTAFFCGSVSGEAFPVDITPGGGLLSSTPAGVITSRGGSFSGISPPSVVNFSGQSTPSSTSSTSSTSKGSSTIQTVATASTAHAAPTKRAAVVDMMAAAALAVLNIL